MVWIPASKPRQPAEKVQKEKEQQKSTQQIPHVDMTKDDHSSLDVTMPIMETDADKLDDPEAEDGKTDIKLIPFSMEEPEEAGSRAQSTTTL